MKEHEAEHENCLGLFCDVRARETVKRVIDLGYADPKHIGLQGHSWGGYQSSFILTQTDLFAAVVTGAPPTNLASFYDETYPGTGTLQQGIMEVGQVRMGEGNTPWTAHELYESQSHLMLTGHITNPELIIMNDRTWNKLTDAQRAAFRRAAAETRAKATEMVVSQEKSQLAKLQSLGMKVIGPEQGLDLKAFQERAHKLVQERFGAKYGALYQQIAAIK